MAIRYGVRIGTSDERHDAIASFELIQELGGVPDGWVSVSEKAFLLPRELTPVECEILAAEKAWR